MTYGWPVEDCSLQPAIVGEDGELEGCVTRVEGHKELRTTLNVDDHALAEAVDASGGKTKTAVINEALRLYARRNRVRRLADLRGRAKWEGDLDALRQRKPAR